MANFIELAILEFGCPGMTHFTRITRMPLMLLLFANKCFYAPLPVVVSLLPSAIQLSNPQLNHFLGKISYKYIYFNNPLHNRMNIVLQAGRHNLSHRCIMTLTICNMYEFKRRKQGCQTWSYRCDFFRCTLNVKNPSNDSK